MHIKLYLKLYKNKLLLFTILLVFTITLSGCYNSKGIEELAYVTAIGFDTSGDNLLSLTLQISLPGSSSSQDSGGSSQSSKTESITVECSSFNSGLALANSYISKELDLSHCKVLVFSEDLAKSGLLNLINTIANNIEIRPNCNVIITKCSAKQYINNAEPSIEAITARYYEVSINSSKYTGYTPSTEFLEFFQNVKKSTIQASAILGRINSYSSKDENSKNENSKDENSKDETSDTVENFGTAVFKDDKFVGELTGLETIWHLMITNKFKSCTISVPNLYNSNFPNIDLKLLKEKNPKIKVEIINGSPFINIEIFVTGYGLSLDDYTDYSSTKILSEINTSAKSYIEKEILNYLYKTSKEFNSDIDGFGKKAISKYLTINDWNNSNWLDNYKNSVFNVNVNVNIKSGYEFNKAP